MSEKNWNDNALFKPIKIGTHTAKNRMIINAMECCDSDKEGNPTDRTYERYTKALQGWRSAGQPRSHHRNLREPRPRHPAWHYAS